MALRSVLEVDVDDSAFKRFSEAFDKYRDALGKMPNAWKNVATSTASMREDFIAMTSALMAHNELLHRASYETERVATASSGLARVWGGITSGARSFVGHLESAVFRLSRFTAIGAGLLGIGGLWGLESYAVSAGGARRKAQGLGTTVPGMMGFEAEFGRFVNPDQFQSTIADSMSDVTQRGRLYALGLTEQQIQAAGGDPNKLTTTALQSIWRRLHTTGLSPNQQQAMIAQMLHGMGDPVSLEEGRRLYAQPYSQIGQAQRRSEEDLRKFYMGLSPTQYDEMLKRWQDFNIQLDVAGKTMWSVFGISLQKWAPELGKLSDTFTQLVRDVVSSPGFGSVINLVTRGLQEFNTYLTSDKFKHDFQDFKDKVSDFAIETADIVKSLAKFIKAIDHVISWFEQPPKHIKVPDPLDKLPGTPSPGTHPTPHTFGRGLPPDIAIGNVKGSQVGTIMATAKEAGAGPLAIQAMLAAGLAEGGLDETWKGSKVDTYMGDPTSFGTWQLHAGGELDRYLQEKNKTGDEVAQTRYVLKRLNEIYPGFSNIKDPKLAAEIIAKFENSKQSADYYQRHFDEAERVMRRAQPAKPMKWTNPQTGETFTRDKFGNWEGDPIPDEYYDRGSPPPQKPQHQSYLSPNVQQPQTVRIALYGNTGAITPMTANQAAVGVY